VKFFALAFAAINLYLGARCFLNLVGVLHTAKYATGTTALFAVLFLGFAAAGAWFALWGGNTRLAFWLGFGPWALAIVVLFIQLVIGDPR
jgi:hypothetical protein